MRSILLLLLLLVAAPALGADPPAPPLPPYAALPAGAAIARVDYYARYDTRQIRYPDPKANNNILYANPKGRTWHVIMKGLKAEATSDDLAEALRAGGWTILVGGSRGVVAHYEKDGHDAWVETPVVGSFTLVEKDDFEHFTMREPGAMPEEIAENTLPPYLVPFPGYHIQSWKRDDKQQCDVRSGGALKDIHLAGPPIVSLILRGPDEVSPLETTEAYDEALAKAGWDVLTPAVAHYAKQGRDLWVQLSSSTGRYAMCIADVGAAAGEAKLKKELDDVGHVAIYGIYFDVDKATLRPEADATLKQIQALLLKYKELKLEIQGHTDNSGTHDHNQKLSEERAAAVKAWLLAHGIHGARLAAAGYAETRPVAPNSTEEGKQKNRRVELARR
jgi:outer membrane protein OmpA-like peptidoglycan-associated protein